MYKTSNLRTSSLTLLYIRNYNSDVSSESYIVSKLILLDFSVTYEKHFQFVFDITQKISIIWQYNVTCFS